MAVDWTRKTGDSHPSISATLTRTTDGVTAAADLTTASSVHAMIACTAVSGTGNIPSTLNEAVTVVNASAGTVRYDLSSSFAALPAGYYQMEFEATYGDGTKETFPDSGYLTGQILQDLG